MADTKIFYCWVKLSRGVASGADAPALAGIPALNAAKEEMKTAGMSPDDMAARALTTFSGGIPPTLFSGGIPPGLRNGGIPPRVLSGGIPPGFRLGGFFSVASWGIDEEYSGKPTSELVVDHAPVAGSREDAKGWLNAHPEWLDASVETFFLMGFAASDKQ